MQQNAKAIVSTPPLFKAVVVVATIIIRIAFSCILESIDELYMLLWKNVSEIFIAYIDDDLLYITGVFWDL
jgi:hypothetical protein